MKRSTQRVSPAVLLAPALLTVAAFTVGQAQNTPQSVARTVKYDVKFSPFFWVDTGEQGPGKGDQTVFDDVLVQGGREVGRQAGFCVVTNHVPNDPVSGLKIACSLTMTLPDGEITLQGLATNAATKRLVITGGTGAYVNARGHATLVEFGLPPTNPPTVGGSMTLELWR